MAGTQREGLWERPHEFFMLAPRSDAPEGGQRAGLGCAGASILRGAQGAPYACPVLSAAWKASQETWWVRRPG